MDRTIWKSVLDAVKHCAARLKPPVRKPTFPDWLIVVMYLWTVWHDRPQGWACDKGHYGTLFRPRKLPSVSQFNRRIKTDSCQHLLQKAHEALACINLPAPLGYLDGKPLPVSPVSKDPDARVGHVTLVGGGKGFGRGYKLHALVTQDGRIPVWSVTALNVHETHAALVMCQHVPAGAAPMLLLADANYDDRDLHKRLHAMDSRLLVPLRGMAMHPVTLRQMGPARRELIELTRAHPDLINFVLSQRVDVERHFSALCGYGGGLGPLPPWVRRLERVRRWVGAKIILYHARLSARRAAAA